MPASLPNPPIRVAVVDDSRSIRKWLRHVLQSDPRLSVVAEAGTGREAREVLRNQQVDVMTLDVEMPGMSGIEFLEQLMVHRPMPVVMVSAHTEAGSEAAIKALSLGAVDCIEKPRTALTDAVGKDICRRVFEAAHVHVRQRRPGLTPHVVARPKLHGGIWQGDVILLGASTGGVSALEELLSEVEGCPQPVVIAQHMPEPFLRSFTQRLNERFERCFCIVSDGLVLEPGQGVLALGKDVSTHLRRRSDGALECVFRPPSETAIYRPNVDDLFRSAAASEIGGAAALLTGMGKDGARGLLELRNRGLTTFAQDERSSVVYGMPKAAQDSGAAMYQGSPGQIGQQIAGLPLKKSVKTRELSR